VLTIADQQILVRQTWNFLLISDPASERSLRFITTTELGWVISITTDGGGFPLLRSEIRANHKADRKLTEIAASLDQLRINFFTRLRTWTNLESSSLPDYEDITSPNTVIVIFLSLFTGNDKFLK
jgi:hypothetical protein